jgi:hypothetical protein
MGFGKVIAQRGPQGFLESQFKEVIVYTAGGEVTTPCAAAQTEFIEKSREVPRLKGVDKWIIRECPRFPGTRQNHDHAFYVSY